MRSAEIEAVKLRNEAPGEAADFAAVVKLPDSYFAGLGVQFWRNIDQ